MLCGPYFLLLNEVLMFILRQTKMWKTLPKNSSHFHVECSAQKNTHMRLTTQKCKKKKTKLDCLNHRILCVCFSVQPRRIVAPTKTCVPLNNEACLQISEDDVCHEGVLNCRLQQRRGIIFGIYPSELYKLTMTVRPILCQPNPPNNVA